jgi:hypothetical protein
MRAANALDAIVCILLLRTPIIVVMVCIWGYHNCQRKALKLGLVNEPSTQSLALYRVYLEFKSPVMSELV